MWEAATICPPPRKLTFDLLTLKVVFESHVTWPTFVPILVFLDLSILDLGPIMPRSMGAGHNNQQNRITLGKGWRFSGDKWLIKFVRL